MTKEKFIFTPYKKGVKNEAGCIVINAEFDDGVKKSLIINGRFISINYTKKCYINLMESGLEYYKEFEVFMSDDGCTVKAKKDNTKVEYVNIRID